MSESDQVCSACGAKGSLELELASGTLACNQCGVVASNSMNEAFEFLGRVDEEDEYTNGRMYVSDKNNAWGGGLAASGVRAMGGRASQWAAGVGEKRTMFHAKKKSEADKWIKRLLHRFDAVSRRNKTITLFSGMKEKMGFRWGYRAEVYAAACVYVAIREDNREIWVQDVLNACDDMMTESIQPLHFARAVRITKLENEIRTPEIDPVMFVERILVHLQQILRDPKPKYHVGQKEKAFLAKNLTWIRGLSLQDARTLAVSLLGFSRELYLVAGRSPEQVACAVVMVALEGIARQPCPVQQQFDDELAWLTKTASFTIQERYREYTKALTDYAPKLPWVASKASKWKKKEVVEYTSDIIQFWRALDAKQKKDKAKKVEEELQAKKTEEELQATRIEEEGDDGKRKWEGKIEGEDGQTDQGRDQLQASEQVYEHEEGYEQVQQYDEDGEEEEASDEEALPENLEDTFDDNRTDSPTASEDDLPDPMKSKAAADVYGFDQDGIAPSKRGGGDKVARPETADKRRLEWVRGSTEWNRRRAAEAALAKGYRPSPSPALSPAPPETYFPDLCLPTPPPLPPASTSKSSSNLNPNQNRPLTSLESNEILAYGHKPEAIRAQLAPGQPGMKRNSDSNRSETRLSRLLWEKTAQDIEDEELFADGELESYLRTNEEVAVVSRTESFSKMIKDANAQKHLEREIRPRRRVRGQINPEFIDLKAEAASKGVSMETVLRRRSRKARGESDEEDVTREFRPRKKKSRVGDEARKRLAAFLAKNGSDEEEEPEEGGQEWVGLAMNVAGNVDGGIGDVDGVDDDEDEQEPEDDHTDGTEWKKQVQYGGFGYDED